MNRPVSFDKNATNLCKGIAISVLVYYHSFGATYDLPFTKVFPTAFNILAPYGDFVIMMFVLLTGYGVGVQCLKSEKAKPFGAQIAHRTVHLYQQFWPVFLLTLIAAPFLASSPGTLADAYGGGTLLQGTEYFIANALGLTHLIFGGGVYTLNQTWWYMSLALVLTFVLPFFCFLQKKWGWKAFLLVFLAALLLPDTRYLPYMPGAMLGVCLAGSNGFVRIRDKSKNIIGLLLHFVLLFAVLLLWYRLRQHIIYPQLADTMLAWALCQFTFDIFALIPVFREIFTFLGKHSANIFFMHSLIFPYWTITHDRVFAAKYDILIWAVIILLTLGLSTGLNWLKKVSRWDNAMNRLETVLCKKITE